MADDRAAHPNQGLAGQQVSEALSSGAGGPPAEGGNHWARYFGPASSEIHTNAYDKYAYETYDLPEAYKGKNLFLRDTIDGFILTDNAWYTRVVLPYAQTDQIHLAWNEWHFNQTLAGRVPHEGVSRLITSSKRQFKDHTIRRGLAFILEHGFMSTAEGREQYRRNLFGIKQCVQETANHDVVSALLTCRNYDREWERKHGLHHSPKRREQIMRREVNEWAIVQKDIAGIEILHEEYKKRLSRYAVTPNLWIFPPKMPMYCAMVPPTGKKPGDVGSDVGKSDASTFAQGESAYSSLRGTPVYETRMFDVYEDELPIDLLCRHQQIGSYFRMEDPYRYGGRGGRDAANPGYRDILVYNEERDNWSRISFREALLNAVNLARVVTATMAGRLDADGGPVRIPGAGSGYNMRPSSAYISIGDFYADHPEALQKVVNHMVESSHPDEDFIPEYMHESMQAAGINSRTAKSAPAAGVAGDFRTVSKSTSGSKAFVTAKDGLVGVYQSCLDLSKNAVKAKPQVGDTKALFLDGVKTQGAWKSLDLQQVMATLGGEVDEVSVSASASDVHDQLHQHCQDIVDKYENPQADVGEKRRRTISTRADFGKRGRARNSGGGGTSSLDDAMSDLLDSHQKEEGVTRSYGGGGAGGGEDHGTYRYAKTFLRHHESLENGELQLIGAPSRRRRRIRLGDGPPAVQGLDPASRGAARYGYPTSQRPVRAPRYKPTAAVISLGIDFMKDPRVGVDILIFRPFQTYQISSAILMRGGLETGATYIGHSDFQLGDDVVSKLHYGNFTFYSKAVVTNPRNVIVARNVFCNAYERGAGVKFFSGNSAADGGSSGVPFGYHPKTGEHEADLISVVVPSGSLKDIDNPVDIRGWKEGREYGGNNGLTQQTTQYPAQAAREVRRAFKTNQYAHDYDEDEEADGVNTFRVGRRSMNTVCFQGHQFSYNVNGGVHNVVTVNTGHWGPNVYPGVGRVRAGEMKYIERQSYQHGTVGAVGT